MPAPRHRLDDDPATKHTATKRTALIVDDEPLVALLLADIVEDADWTVLGPASSGAEAIALATQIRPDLALIDVNIDGEQDGIAVAQTLKAEFGIKVVLISGYSDLADQARVQAVRPFAVLSKPCLPSEIERLLHAAESAD